MKEEITQVKFSKEYDGQTVSVVCTRSDIDSTLWDCKFSKISLVNLAHFVVELFNCDTLSAESLCLNFGKKYCIPLDKDIENNTFTHYLVEIASELDLIG